MGSARSKQDEPARHDLRTTTCVPYPFVADQGDSVSCVAHAFATALYCSRCLHNDVLCNPYPRIGDLFARALRETSEPSMGLSFASVERVLREEAAELGCSSRSLPNDAATLREVLRQGSAVVLGYQVNEAIDRFHRSASVCRQAGFLMPSFRERPHAVSSHAVLIVGYDLTSRCFIVRNSWGSQWGVDGHCWLRFQDVEDSRFATDLAHLVCSGRPRQRCR